MSLSSNEARSFQFSGTEHSYDAADVERFRKLVVAALAEGEDAAGAIATDPAPAGAADELAAAQRARQQAVQLAERMLREVMGASGEAEGGLEVWQEAAVLRALAAEELEFATEEARRLPAVAEAERDEIRKRYAEERIAVRRELQTELQASRAAATSEAEAIREAARSEGAELLKTIMADAEKKQREVANETQRLERRLEVLQTAVADAESRFRRLASLAANEMGTLSAISDQDVVVSQPRAASSPAAASPTVASVPQAVGAEPGLDISEVDLREDAAASVTTDDDEDAPHYPKRDPEVGFYQRRLAGLRDRLEKSGHPPQ